MESFEDEFVLDATIYVYDVYIITCTYIIV